MAVCGPCEAPYFGQLITHRITNMSCLFPVTDSIRTTESIPTDEKTVFQWEGSLAHFPWDLTHFSVVLVIQPMLDPYREQYRIRR